jgi:hypothetical protein
MIGQEHFSAKWTPVRRRKCDHELNLKRIPILLDRNTL